MSSILTSGSSTKFANALCLCSAKPKTTSRFSRVGGSMSRLIAILLSALFVVLVPSVEADTCSRNETTRLACGIVQDATGTALGAAGAAQEYASCFTDEQTIANWTRCL